MSAKVKMGTKLPGDTTINGLDYLAADLVEHQEDGAIFVMGVMDVSDVSVPTGGEPVPRVRWRKLEVVGYVGTTEVGDLPPVPVDLQKAFLARAEARQGMAPLPFDALDAPKGDEGDFDVL